MSLINASLPNSPYHHRPARPGRRHGAGAAHSPPEGPGSSAVHRPSARFAVAVTPAALLRSLRQPALRLRRGAGARAPTATRGRVSLPAARLPLRHRLQQEPPPGRAAARAGRGHPRQHARRCLRRAGRGRARPAHRLQRHEPRRRRLRFLSAAASASTSTRSISSGTSPRAGPAGAVGLRLLVDEPARPNRIGVDAGGAARGRWRSPRAAACALDRAAHVRGHQQPRARARFLACLDRCSAAARLLPDLDATSTSGGGFGVAYRDGAGGRWISPTLGARGGRRGWRRSRRARRPAASGWCSSPGARWSAAAGTLLVTVVSVKERGGRRYVGVDSTVGNIVVESVYHPHHRVEAVAPRGAALELPDRRLRQHHPLARLPRRAAAGCPRSRPAICWPCATWAPTATRCRATS